MLFLLVIILILILGFILSLSLSLFDILNVQTCKNYFGGGALYDNLIYNSNTFFQKYPFHTYLPKNNRIANWAKTEENKSKIEKWMQSTYPIYDKNIIGLLKNFIKIIKLQKNKLIFGKLANIYDTITLEKLIRRLLICRPYCFYGSDNTTLLRNFREDQIIKNESEMTEADLNDYICYEEIELAALMGMSVPTFFINDGGKYNNGNYKDNDFVEEGICIGSVGTRFELQNKMEYKYMIIDESQNTSSFAKNILVLMWKEFYKYLAAIKYTYLFFPNNPIIDIPCYSNIDLNGSNLYLTLDKNHEFVGDYYLNVSIYMLRIALVNIPFLLDANKRAQEHDTKKIAYVVTTGLGLGVWITSDNQFEYYFKVFKKILENNYYPNIHYIEFNYFDDKNILKYFNKVFGDNTELKNYEYPCFYQNNGINHTIIVYCTKQNPATKERKTYGTKITKFDEKQHLLVSQYAWDGNSYPGNEYWNNSNVRFTLDMSMDPATACCTIIPELQNPEINIDAFKEENMIKDVEIDEENPFNFEYIETEEAVEEVATEVTNYFKINDKNCLELIAEESIIKQYDDIFLAYNDLRNYTNKIKYSDCKLYENCNINMTNYRFLSFNKNIFLYIHDSDFTKTIIQIKCLNNLIENIIFIFNKKLSNQNLYNFYYFELKDEIFEPINDTALVNNLFLINNIYLNKKRLVYNLTFYTNIIDSKKCIYIDDAYKIHLFKDFNKTIIKILIFDFGPSKYSILQTALDKINTALKIKTTTEFIYYYHFDKTFNCVNFNFNYFNYMTTKKLTNDTEIDFNGKLEILFSSSNEYDLENIIMICGMPFFKNKNDIYAELFNDQFYKVYLSQKDENIFILKFVCFQDQIPKTRAAAQNGFVSFINTFLNLMFYYNKISNLLLTPWVDISTNGTNATAENANANGTNTTAENATAANANTTAENATNTTAENATNTTAANVNATNALLMISNSGSSSNGSKKKSKKKKKPKKKKPRKKKPKKKH